MLKLRGTGELSSRSLAYRNWEHNLSKLSQSKSLTETWWVC